MRLLVHASDAGTAYVGINLRGRNVGMSHHFLHTVQIRPVFHQMGRKRMPERMRRYVRFYPGLSGIIFDQLPETLTAHGLTGAVNKKSLSLRPFYQDIPGFLQLMKQRLLRLVPKWYGTFLR